MTYEDLHYVLLDLHQLAVENIEVVSGSMGSAEYRRHCDLVLERIEKTFAVDKPIPGVVQ